MYNKGRGKRVQGAPLGARKKRRYKIMTENISKASKANGYVAGIVPRELLPVMTAVKSADKLRGTLLGFSEKLKAAGKNTDKLENFIKKVGDYRKELNRIAIGVSKEDIIINPNASSADVVNAYKDFIDKASKAEEAQKELITLIDPKFWDYANAKKGHEEVLANTQKIKSELQTTWKELGDIYPELKQKENSQESEQKLEQARKIFRQEQA